MRGIGSRIPKQIIKVTFLIACQLACGVDDRYMLRSLAVKAQQATMATALYRRVRGSYLRGQFLLIDRIRNVLAGTSREKFAILVGSVLTAYEDHICTTVLPSGSCSAWESGRDRTRDNERLSASWSHFVGEPTALPFNRHTQSIRK